MCVCHVGAFVFGGLMNVEHLIGMASDCEWMAYRCNSF